MLKKLQQKRTEVERQLHDAMLAAIFKALHEDIVPNRVPCRNLFLKHRMGCDILKVIDFRSLPVQVQDDLMRAEIRLCGLATVIGRAMLFATICHTLTPRAANNMYPAPLDIQYTEWNNELMRVPSGHRDPIQQVVVSAYECAISIFDEIGAYPTRVENFNVFQLDLFA